MYLARNLIVSQLSNYFWAPENGRLCVKISIIPRGIFFLITWIKTESLLFNHMFIVWVKIHCSVVQIKITKIIVQKWTCGLDCSGAFRANNGLLKQPLKSRKVEIHFWENCLFFLSISSWNSRPLEKCPSAKSLQNNHCVGHSLLMETVSKWVSGKISCCTQE